MKFFLAGAASERKNPVFRLEEFSPAPPIISRQKLSQEKTALLTTTTYPVVLVLVVLGQPLFKRREVFPEGSGVHFGSPCHDLHNLLPGLRLAEPQHLQQLRSGEFAAWKVNKNNKVIAFAHNSSSQYESTY